MTGILLLLNEQTQVRRAQCELRLVSIYFCLHVGLSFTLSRDERSKF